MIRDIIIKIVLFVPLVLLPIAVAGVGIYAVITLYIAGESFIRSILLFSMIIVLCVFTVKIGIDILRRR